MENVTITETRGGNPKYIIDDLGVTIRVELRNGDDSAQVRIRSPEIDYAEITGKEIKSNIHEIYLTRIPAEAYPSFCESLIISIQLLAQQGLTIPQIADFYYKQYHNEEETKKEVFNLQTEFRDVKKDFDNLKTKMDNLCRKMEML